MHCWADAQIILFTCGILSVDKQYGSDLLLSLLSFVILYVEAGMWFDKLYAGDYLFIFCLLLHIFVYSLLIVVSLCGYTPCSHFLMTRVPSCDPDRHKCTSITTYIVHIVVHVTTGITCMQWAIELLRSFISEIYIHSWSTENNKDNVRILFIPNWVNLVSQS